MHWHCAIGGGPVFNPMVRDGKRTGYLGFLEDHLQKNRQCYQKSATIGDYTSVVSQQKYKQTLRKRGRKKPSAANSASSANTSCYSASAVFLPSFFHSQVFFKLIFLF